MIIPDGTIFAHITCTRVKWEATVGEMADMQGKTPEEIREEWEDDSDYDAASDTIRLEDCMEEHGWIDRSWSRTCLHESRNDVRPAINSTDYDLTDPDENEEFEQDIRELLEWLPGGFHDNGNGSFYSKSRDETYTDPWEYEYAVHFSRKFFGPNGRAEVPWHPVTDGGMTL